MNNKSRPYVLGIALHSLVNTFRKGPQPFNMLISSTSAKRPRAARNGLYLFPLLLRPYVLLLQFARCEVRRVSLSWLRYINGAVKSAFFLTLLHAIFAISYEQTLSP